MSASIHKCLLVVCVCLSFGLISVDVLGDSTPQKIEAKTEAERNEQVPLSAEYLAGFRLAKDGAVSEEDLNVSNGEVAVSVGGGNSGFKPSVGRVYVSHRPGEGPDGSDMADIMFGGGLFVASTRLAKEPISATWSGCTMPSLPHDLEAQTKLFEAIKAGDKKSLPAASSCQVTFPKRKFSVDFKYTGLLPRLREGYVYQMETRVRLDGKEYLISDKLQMDVEWIGDLDGDGNPDLVFSIGNSKDPTEVYQLWMFNKRTSRYELESIFYEPGC